MECIIQVFPDDFHLATLKKFLASCLELQPGVDLRSIYTSLMDRLANYFDRNQNLESTGEASEEGGGHVFDTFVTYIDKTLQKGLELSAFLTVQISLANLALKCYPKNINYVDRILGNCAEQISQAAKKLGSHKGKQPQPKF